MADGMIVRGEVYWVSLDDSIGSEIQTGRPAVIISGNRANETSPCVLVAFISSQGGPHPHNVSVKVNGEFRRVKCDQIRTVAKERLTRYVCTLQNHEMIRVTGALATAMCIPLRGPETSNGQENKEMTALKAECEMWKRCYDVAMTQLVDLKVNSDLALRMARAGYDYEESGEFEEEVSAEEPVENEEPVMPEPSVEETKPEPVEEQEQVVVEPEVPEIVEPEKTPEIVEAAVGETTVVGDKLNINTASAKEIIEKLGVNAGYAYTITGYRNKNGNFVDLKELLEVKHLPKTFYEKYKDQLTLGGEEPKQPEPPQEPKKPEPPKEEEAPKKLNINTASTRELMEVGFGKSAAAMIVSTRKKYGRFRSVDDLADQPEVSGKILRKLRDKLEV